jgi:hypothetical protein
MAERRDGQLSPTLTDPAPGAPNSENCRVTGVITSPVALMLINSDLPWGKWMQGPIGAVPAGARQVAFQAWGRPNVPTGAEGSVTY